VLRVEPGGKHGIGATASECAKTDRQSRRPNTVLADATRINRLAGWREAERFCPITARRQGLVVFSTGQIGTKWYHWLR